MSDISKSTIGLRILVALGFVSILLGCSNAHVLVVDQRGKPVEGVRVVSTIQPGNAYFTGSEPTIKYTDKEGRVELPIGSRFTLAMVEKKGYQFREFVQLHEEFGSDRFGASAKRFTEENPLVVQGWLRETQAELTYKGGTAYYPDTAGQCTIELVQPNSTNGLKDPIILTLGMNTEFVKKYYTNPRRPYFMADIWSADIRLSNAQLLDTRDLFLNEAPEAGYQDEINLGPFKFGGNPIGIDYKERRLFIRGKNGDFYGGAVVFLEPARGRRTELGGVNKLGVSFQAWFNFDGSRNIMRSPEQIAWHHGHPGIHKRIYCREAPQTWR